MEIAALRCCCGVAEVGTFGFRETYKDGKHGLETIEEFEERFTALLRGGSMTKPAFVIATLVVGTQTNTFEPLLLKMGFRMIDTEVNGNSGNRVCVYLVKRNSIKFSDTLLAKLKAAAQKIQDDWARGPQTEQVAPAIPTPRDIASNILPIQDITSHQHLRNLYAEEEARRIRQGRR